MDIPEVIFKFILNYVGSSPFPMNTYMNHKRPKYPMLHPHSLPKNIEISHPQALEETKMLEQ